MVSVFVARKKPTSFPGSFIFPSSLTPGRPEDERRWKRDWGKNPLIIWCMLPFIETSEKPTSGTTTSKWSCCFSSHSPHQSWLAAHRLPWTADHWELHAEWRLKQINYYQFSIWILGSLFYCVLCLILLFFVVFCIVVFSYILFCFLVLLQCFVSVLCCFSCVSFHCFVLLYCILLFCLVSCFVMLRHVCILRFTWKKYIWLQ